MQHSSRAQSRAMTERERRFWIGIRQALIIALGNLEDYLEMERSITPKHKRERSRPKR